MNASELATELSTDLGYTVYLNAVSPTKQKERPYGLLSFGNDVDAGSRTLISFRLYKEKVGSITDRTTALMSDYRLVETKLLGIANSQPTLTLDKDDAILLISFIGQLTHFI